MKSIYTTPFFLILIFSCNSNSNDVSISELSVDTTSNSNVVHDMEMEDLEPTDIEHQEWLTGTRNDEFHEYPEVYSSSLRNLKLIHKKWTSGFLVCSENENFRHLQMISNTDSVPEFVAISSISSFNTKDIFFFYHFDLNQKILFKQEIKGADFSCTRNLIQKKNEISFYYSTNETSFYIYDLESLELRKYGPTSKNYPSPNQSERPKNESPDKTKSIIFDNNTLILENRKNQIFDTLIAQEYSGEWSFGDITWHDNSLKFYFDNSGPAACIWELDTKNRTLDKIVAEHEANCPVFLIHEGYDYVVYCEKNSIKYSRIRSN